MMKVDDLKDKVAEILEIDSSEIDESFEFSAIPEFDSMAILGLIVVLDENFGTTFKTVQLRGLSSFQSLLNLVGTDKFEA